MLLVRRVALVRLEARVTLALRVQLDRRVLLVQLVPLDRLVFRVLLVLRGLLVRLVLILLFLARPARLVPLERLDLAVLRVPLRRFLVPPGLLAQWVLQGRQGP